ncbi:phage holin family protein [Orrella sp. JC864]|uniref:phage holin family protein n=1 Tax=Orrella sp. JC864 TaxID=3120298 RepID=UPI00300A83C7
MLEQIIVLIAVVANLATAGRLLAYQRAGARYRPLISCMAYVLIVCTGAEALSILLGASTASVWSSGVAVVLSVLVWRARGNVARIVRVQA